MFNVTGRTPGRALRTREQEIVHRLPDGARNVLAEIRQEHENHGVLLSAAIDKKMEAHSTKVSLERQLRTYSENREVQRSPEGFEHQTEKLEAEIATAKAEMRTADELSEVRGHRRTRSAHLIDAIENYILAVPAETLIVPFRGEIDVKPPRGDLLLDSVEALQRKILDRRADLAAIEAAPISSVVAKQMARKQIGEIAARGEPSCFGLIENRAAIGWPRTTYYDHDIDPRALFDTSAPPIPTAAPGFDAFSFYIWHNRDAVIAAIEAKIDEAADDASALSDDERSKRRLVTLADILRIEREEEALIRIGKKKGLSDLHRRSDADPRAVLGIV